MAHFYGSITGQAGTATRMGSKGSGYHAWAQGWGSRIEIYFNYNSREDRDDAGITITGGGSSSARSRHIDLPNVDAIVNALDSADPKIERIWGRIRDNFGQLADEAPKAVEREKRRQERERRREARERKAYIRQQGELWASLDSTEIKRLCKLSSPHVSWADIYNGPDGPNTVYLRRQFALSTENGHIVTMATPRASWGAMKFDLTAGQWVLDFDADDLGLDSDKLYDFGYRVERQEVSA